MTPIKARQNISIGIASAVASALAAAFMMVFVHNTYGQFDPSDLLFFRSLFFVLILMPLAIRERKQVFSLMFLQLIVTSFAAGVSIWLLYYATQRMPISDVSAIFSLTPIGVALLANVFLGERFFWYQTIGCTIAIAGVFLLSFSPQSPVLLWPLLAVLGSVVLRAIFYVYLRFFAQKVSAILVVFAFSLSGVFCSLIMQPNTLKLAGAYLDQNLWGMSIAALIMQVTMTLGFRHLKAGAATLIEQVEIIFAAVLGYMFHGHLSTVWQCMCFAIIIVGVILGQYQRKST